MITKKDLKEIKEKLKSLYDDLEKVLEHENIDKMTIVWGKNDVESPNISIGMFLPRLQWMNKRLDRWIDIAPAGKRGPKKKGVVEEIQESIKQMDEGLGIPADVVKGNIKRRRVRNAKTN